MSVALRRATRPYTLRDDVIVQPGQEVYASVIEANENAAASTAAAYMRVGGVHWSTRPGLGRAPRRSSIQDAFTHPGS